MQHSKSACFGGRGNKGIDEGERAMLAPGCKSSLDLQCSLVISVRGGYCGKRPQSVGDLPVVVGASGRVSEFECDRAAQSYLSSGGKWGKSRGHGWLGQPCEDTGVDQIADACHLFVGTPGPFDLFEVEATVLGEQCDELQPAPGVDDLAQGSIDGRSQRGRAENLRSLFDDVWVNFDGCLRHASMISDGRNLYTDCPISHAPERRSAPVTDRRGWDRCSVLPFVRGDPLLDEDGLGHGKDCEGVPGRLRPLDEVPVGRFEQAHVDHLVE